MIVGNADCRIAPRTAMSDIGYQCAEVDDPYAAMAEICRRPLVYRALVLSLNSLFREELSLIETIKRRFGHIDIWLTDTDGRQAALAEALRLGADGLIAEDGIHRIGSGSPPPQRPPAVTIIPPQPISEAPPLHEKEDNEQPLKADPPADASGEPILTAEELRALLQEDETTHEHP